MKGPNENRENKEQEDKSKTIENIESQENIYPSAIQGLFERLGLE